MPDNILPRNLKTHNDDFYGEVREDHYFNWRWFKDTEGRDVKVVTLEDFEDSVPAENYKSLEELESSHGMHKMVSPDMLIWASDFVEGNKDLAFQWRWYRRGKTEAFYKVLTLEDIYY